MPSGRAEPRDRARSAACVRCGSSRARAATGARRRRPPARSQSRRRGPPGRSATALRLPRRPARRSARRARRCVRTRRPIVSDAPNWARVTRGLAEAARDDLEQDHCHARGRLEVAAQDPAEHHQRLDGLERRHRSDARLAVDEGELAEQVAGVADAEHHFPALALEARHLHSPGEERHHPVVGLALEHQHASPREPAALADRLERLALGPGEALEERARHEPARTGGTRDPGCVARRIDSGRRRVRAGRRRTPLSFPWHRTVPGSCSAESRAGVRGARAHRAGVRGFQQHELFELPASCAPTQATRSRAITSLGFCPARQCRSAPPRSRRRGAACAHPRARSALASARAWILRRRSGAPTAIAERRADRRRRER